MHMQCTVYDEVHVRTCNATHVSILIISYTAFFSSMLSFSSPKWPHNTVAKNRMHSSLLVQIADALGLSLFCRTRKQQMITCQNINVRIP